LTEQSYEGLRFFCGKKRTSFLGANKADQSEKNGQMSGRYEIAC
jgi:hypothetical protein